MAQTIPEQCFLCQSPLSDEWDGYRIVSGERTACFLEWYSGSSESLDPADSIYVCYSKCPLFTGFLYHEAAQRLSDNEYRQELDDLTIRDAPFSLGYIDYNPDLYDVFLSEKRQNVIDRIQRSGMALPAKGVETFESPRKHFRQRCRFGVHIKEHINNETVLFNTEEMKARDVLFLMWTEEGIPYIPVESFPIASKLINDLLQPIRDILSTALPSPLPRHDSILSSHLSAIHFLTTTSFNAIVFMVYEKDKHLEDMDEAWILAAKYLVESLLNNSSIESLNKVSVIAQSKGVKIVYPPDTDIVEEELTVVSPHVQEDNISEPLKVKYHFPIDGFSNPNAAVNAKCLGWLLSLFPRVETGEEGWRLLELYCGAANHTVALAKYCNCSDIVGVELNKALCRAAEFNLHLNGITSARIIQGQSEKYASSFIRRLQRGDDEDKFDVVLVDPPRGGLDATTRSLLQTFDRIIYISCNPLSLERDLKLICFSEDSDTPHYAIERMAVFDHFAYSKEHLETGVLVVRI